MNRCAICESTTAALTPCMACEQPVCAKDAVMMEHERDESRRGVVCTTCAAELATQGYKTLTV